MVATPKHASLMAGTLVLAAAGAVGAAEPASGPSRIERLDLKAPHISLLFTPQQIEMILARALDPNLESVEVEAPRIADLPLRDKSAAPVEVVFKEVVRWLAPYPGAIAARVNRAPDATDPYRPVPLSVSSYQAGIIVPYSQR